MPKSMAEVATMIAPNRGARVIAGSARSVLVVATTAALAMSIADPERASAADVAGEAPSSSCRISIVGTSSAPRWKLAVDNEQRRLETLPRSVVDECRTIELHVTLDGALLVLTTKLGQQAVRPIASPDDLDATIDALLVTIPAAAPLPASSASDAASAVAPAESAGAPPDREVAPAHHAHVVGAFPFPVFLEAGVGARVVGSSGWAAPSFDIRASMTAIDWTFGVYFALEPTYFGVPFTDDDSIEASSFALGALVGRRWQLGSALCFALNGRLAIGWFDESRDAESESAEVGLRRVEARIGVEAAMGVRIFHDFSIRPRVAFEVMPSFLARSDLQDPRVPNAPSYAVTFGVGGELGFLPSPR